MILRVPDYYDEFVCIADRCTGSCCDGWEIDIDDASGEYYMQAPGPIGERLRSLLYQGEDGGYCFRLGEQGRCPFLNERNLCDIYEALGEEALSEVCTDFPRFALTYGRVMQRILSLSCEEAGRIILFRKEPVTFVESAMPESMAEWEDEDADEAYIAFLEDVQWQAIAILQDRSRPLKDRVSFFLGLCARAQERINQESTEKIRPDEFPPSDNFRVRDWERPCYGSFDVRLGILEELEELGSEWALTKRRLRQVLTAESYERLLASYLASEHYDEVIYEQLFVYFAFRYLMYAMYSCDILAQGKMVVSFALMVRDLDLCQWSANGGTLSPAERTRMAYLFSREVEHSEENFEQVQEELMFE